MTWSAGDILQPLPARRDLRNHSPDGFAWGYGALRIYQEFKWRFVATLAVDQSWQVSRDAIVALCAEIDSAFLPAAEEA